MLAAGVVAVEPAAAQDDLQVRVLGVANVVADLSAHRRQQSLVEHDGPEVLDLGHSFGQVEGAAIDPGGIDLFGRQVEDSIDEKSIMSRFLVGEESPDDVETSCSNAARSRS